MKLHILGCGDAFGSGGRNQSGYLVEATDKLFLLDCGPTTLLALKRAGFDPRRLDAILLSHLHGDHFGGIAFFFIEYLYLQPRLEPLVIAGPPGTEAKVRALFQVMYGGGAAEKEIPPTRFVVLRPDEPLDVNGIAVAPFRVPHQSDAISLGLKVGYEGKTDFVFRRFVVDRTICRTCRWRRSVSLRVLVLSRATGHACQLSGFVRQPVPHGMQAAGPHPPGRRDAVA